MHKYATMYICLGRPQPPEDIEYAGVTSQKVELSIVPGFSGGFPQRFTVQYRFSDKPDQDESYKEHARGQLLQHHSRNNEIRINPTL